MKNNLADNSRSPSAILSSPWLFFALVFCWTWSFWLSAAEVKASVQTTLGSALLLLGLCGPMVGGITLTYLTEGREGRREYWSRIVDPRRIGAKWYLLILLFVPVLMVLAVLIDVAANGNEALVELQKRMTSFPSAPSTIVPFAFGVFIRGPLTEELGWRGYVLDRLQSKWNALTASLILGVIWALWHLPLFFIKDMIHNTEGIGSAWCWQFLAGVVAMSVIITWIFNNTRRSTLAAILFHFTANVSYVLANVTAGTNLYSTLLWIIAAIAVAAWWGTGRLAERLTAAP